jgi:hypothetical protein
VQGARSYVVNPTVSGLAGQRRTSAVLLEVPGTRLPVPEGQEHCRAMAVPIAQAAARGLIPVGNRHAIEPPWRALDHRRRQPPGF